MPAKPFRTCEEVTLERSQLWANGYRPLSVRTNNKPPSDRAWPEGARATPPFSAANPAQSWALNTGILCDGLRAVDIDVDDPIRASSIRELAFTMLGGAPARWRWNSSRLLLLYRATEGTPKKRSITSAVHANAEGKAEKVEILGYGQQFVAYGIHPSGVRLEWWPQGPLQIRCSDLPATTEDQITAFLAKAAKIIGAPTEAIYAPAPRVSVPVGAPPHSAASLAPVGERERTYAAKALGKNTAELSGLRSGRNRACNAIGYRMGRMVAAGWIDRTTVESALYAAMTANGWRNANRDGDRKARATLQSGLTSGMRSPHPPLPTLPDTSNWREEWEAIWRSVQERGRSLEAGMRDDV